MRMQLFIWSLAGLNGKNGRGLLHRHIVLTRREIDANRLQRRNGRKIFNNVFVEEGRRRGIENHIVVLFFRMDREMVLLLVGFVVPVDDHHPLVE